MKINKNKLLLIYEKINNILNKIQSKYKITLILMLGITLILCDCITINRLINFGILLLIIACYKILHKNIGKIYSYINNKTDLTDKDITHLLKIYKYKNPLIIILIGIEEKFFNYIYILTKKNFKIKYINIIYNILYNLTGYNGIKIVLGKFYQILNNGKNYTIYEIMFKRIYGMIFSVLIFTNIIKIVLNILNTISSNGIFGIYIFFISLNYISNYLGGIELKNIINIEYYRMESNLIGTILKQGDYKNLLSLKINKIDLNKKIKMYLGYLYANNKKLLNYKNLLGYRALNMLSGTEYANKPSLFYLNKIINDFYLIENYVITKHHKLQKVDLTNIEQQALMYCEYEILIYKLIVFYLGDVEKTFNITKTYLNVVKEHIDITFYIYEYDKNFIKTYIEKLNNVKLDKFGDLQENIKFYEKMYNYLYDIDFEESKEYKKIQDIYSSEEFQENGLAEATSEEYRGIELKIQEEYLKKQLKEGRDEGETYVDQELIKKYDIIFSEIENLKKKYKDGKR